MAAFIKPATQRERLTVQGIVQGVGFRPFVYGLAVRLQLTGVVLNNSEGVVIEVEGEAARLESFRQALVGELPPLARIDTINRQYLTPLGESGFVIGHSESGAERHALIAPDTATCKDCLQELFDPSDRRFHYPFINCTNCGPRFTIIRDVPYDRDKTTMQKFRMCPDCQAEYDNPLNRRFHAQPNACPECGPKVWLLDAEKRLLPESDPITTAVKQLAAGAILAIKGLGGFHLACDALNSETVSRLRRSKRREAKPFALMVPDVATARRLCAISEAEENLLTSHRRPIVLLKQLPDSPVAPEVAPRYDTLGLMLPYTPLHHLLLRIFATEIGPERPAVLVMTSGNMSDEPIVYKDMDAEERLATIAEGWLLHNREIHMRCDDSVTRIMSGGQQILRRSRGYAPEPVLLGFDFPVPLLACGGHLKNTFCLGKGRQAFLSHHIGDLENLETLVSYRSGIEHFERLFDIEPQAVAYDLHPEYLASKYALELSVPHRIGVQHHHAHLGSVMAEHGLEGPVIGIAADGTGYGADGTIWGCEIMLADLRKFERLAHLAYVPLPGGEQAVRQPWRMAASYLSQTYGEGFLTLDIPFTRELDPKRWLPLARMIERGINSPLTSSLGRLFDAVAALLGLRSEVLYEAQAAIELETILQPTDFTYPYNLIEGQPAVLDVGPLIRAIVQDLREETPLSLIAGRFHSSVAAMLAQVCAMACDQTGIRQVALSGGVFQNRFLLEQLHGRLQERKLEVYLNRLVPPNDGGLSLGQAAIAAARLK
ncbi:MAG TPA: carbamoyltransferase HypF [Chloroflexia bacterium]|nr:carbamoyltransferase HypF [Chloroflexia bacterium]